MEKPQIENNTEELFSSEKTSSLRASLQTLLEYGHSPLFYFKDLYERGAGRQLINIMLEYEEEHSFDHPDYYSILAELNFDFISHADAVDVLKSGLEKYPLHLKLSLFLAQLLVKEGDYPAATLILEDLPDSSEVNWLKGRIFFESQENDLAIDHLQRAVSTEQGNPDYYHSLGLAYQKGAHLKEAVDAFKMSMHFSSSDTKKAVCHEEIGICLIDLKQPEKARAQFEGALYLDYENKRHHENLIFHLFNLGEEKKAMQCLVDSAQKFKTLPADIYQGLKAFPQFSFKSAQICFDFSQLLSELGEKDGATILCLQATRLDPENVLFNSRMCSIYRSGARYQEALPYLRKACALEPDSVFNKQNLFQALLALGIFEEAYELAMGIREKDPENPLLVAKWDYLIDKYLIQYTQATGKHWKNLILN